jgi:hypothetical protein
MKPLRFPAGLVVVMSACHAGGDEPAVVGLLQEMGARIRRDDSMASKPVSPFPFAYPVYCL